MTPITRRILQISAAGLVLSCSLAAAQTPLRTQPNLKEKQKLAGQIASDGLNCPVVGIVDDAGKDERGVMIRVQCRSLNGSARWDVRGIAAKGAAELRFEAW
ncbi:hypothetical protein [Bradyrhizobium sp.]|uniref:hypothetical protein n=1 Tax=Bradyrhizobium sp. TaxID=376 RepID=UPI0025BF9606|nr:hypothetical protein [Bradyrhizobium sp.]